MISAWWLLSVIPAACVGCLFAALCKSSNRGELVIDDIEKIKTNMCESCSYPKRYETIYADNKALEEQNKSIHRSNVQVSARAERLQRELDYLNRLRKVA